MSLDSDYNIKGALTIGTQGSGNAAALDVDVSGNVFYGLNYYETNDPDLIANDAWTTRRDSAVIGKVDGQTRSSVWVRFVDFENKYYNTTEAAYIPCKFKNNQDTVRSMSTSKHGGMILALVRSHFVWQEFDENCNRNPTFADGGPRRTGNA